MLARLKAGPMCAVLERVREWILKKNTSPVESCVENLWGYLILCYFTGFFVPAPHWLCRYIRENEAAKIGYSDLNFFPLVRNVRFCVKWRQWEDVLSILCKFSSLVFLMFVRHVVHTDVYRSKDVWEQFCQTLSENSASRLTLSVPRNHLRQNHFNPKLRGYFSKLLKMSYRYGHFKKYTAPHVHVAEFKIHEVPPSPLTIASASQCRARKKTSLHRW